MNMTTKESFTAVFSDTDTKAILESSGVVLSDLLLACFSAVDADGEPTAGAVSIRQCGNTYRIDATAGDNAAVGLVFQPDDNALCHIITDSIDDLSADRLLELVEHGVSFIPSMAEHFWELAQAGAIEINGDFIRHVEPEMSLEDAAFADDDDAFLVINDADGDAIITVTVKDALIVRPHYRERELVGKVPVIWNLADMNAELFTVTKAA